MTLFFTLSDMLNFFGTSRCHQFLRPVRSGISDKASCDHPICLLITKRLAKRRTGSGDSFGSMSMFFVLYRNLQSNLTPAPRRTAFLYICEQAHHKFRSCTLLQAKRISYCSGENTEAGESHKVKTPTSVSSRQCNSLSHASGIAACNHRTRQKPSWHAAQNFGTWSSHASGNSGHAASILHRRYNMHDTKKASPKIEMKEIYIADSQHVIARVGKATICLKLL